MILGKMQIPFSKQFITDGLLAYFSFEETSGGAINSVTGLSYSAYNVYRGITGKENKCYQFGNPPSNGFLNLPSNLRFLITDTFTFSGWIYRLTTAGSTMFRVYNSTYSFTPINIAFFGSNAGVQLADRNANSIFVTNDTKPNAVNEWINFTVTYNGNLDASGINVYLNGVKSNSVLSNQQIVASLGTTNAQFGPAMDHYFDEFAVWDRVLSDLEVSQLYSSGNGLFYNA